MQDRLSTLACGFLAFSDTNIILEVNAYTNRLLGYEGEELAGRELPAILSPGTRMLFQAHIYPLLAREGRADELYLGLRAKDGTDVPCLVNAARLREGDVWSNQLVFIPMRKRQYFEREYLGARQGARLAQQAERDVRQKLEHIESKMAGSERLIALGTLAAGVAHEVNNPLTYVLWSLESLRNMFPAAVKKRRQGEVSQVLDDLQLGADLIRAVVGGLKLFSRRDSGPQANVNVGDVVRATERMVRFEVRPKAGLEIACEDPAPVVVADEGKLVQVMINLVLNAAQAFPEATPTNKIELSVGTEGSTVIIEVRDNGPGIPLELQDRIFEPFFTTKPTGVGTGLGLSICHGIVLSFGGTLSVRSSPGAGATFRVTLPALVDS